MSNYHALGMVPRQGDRIEVVGAGTARYEHRGKAGTVVGVNPWRDGGPILETDVRVRVDGEPADARPSMYYPNELRPLMPSEIS